MTDVVQVSRRALRALKPLPRQEQQRIRAAVELLAETPRPPGCVAMKGRDSTYRVRVGDYRIVYKVQDAMLLVLVLAIGNRKTVYR